MVGDDGRHLELVKILRIRGYWMPSHREDTYIPILPRLRKHHRRKEKKESKSQNSRKSDIKQCLLEIVA